MKWETQKRILVVAAHPDDEVLGCGASIAKFVQEGNEAFLLILGQGVTSRRRLSSLQKRRGVKELQKNARVAAGLLGFKNVWFRSFPDNAFDSVQLLRLVHAIEEVIEKVKPSRIYTHHGGDLNVDHRLTHVAVKTAARPLPSSSVSEILVFEVPSSSEWNFGEKKHAFHPALFEQISPSQLAEKLAALEAYRSEVRAFPHPRSRQYVEALAKVRGGQAGFNLAEAFEIIYCRRR